MNSEFSWLLITAESQIQLTEYREKWASPMSVAPYPFHKSAKKEETT